MRRKTPDVLSILIIVFGINGIVFSAAAVAIGLNIDAVKASPNSHGNVEILPVIFGILGIIFLVVAIATAAALHAKNKRNRALREEGIRIYAEIVNVDHNYNVKINNRHPYIIECVYTDPITGREYSFRSGNIMSDVRNMVGQQTMVYVDRNDYSKYVVETFDL